MADEQEPPTSDLTFHRAADFADKYANNVRFESSVWDLRILFGLLNQSTTPLTVEQHTAMNLPWAQAKLMAYFLQMNVLFHEAENGKIIIPDAVMPAQVDENAFEAFGDNPAAMAVLERLKKLYAELP